MLGPRVSVVLAVSNRLLLLFGPLVTLVPVHTSPPAMNTLPVCGSTSCELQKMSVPVPFGSVRWFASGAPMLSHTSTLAWAVCSPLVSEP